MERLTSPSQPPLPERNATPAARGDPQRRRNTWILALAAALHGLVFLVLLPPWMGEDEPWHFEYVRHAASGYQPWGGLPALPASGARPDDRVHLPPSQLQIRRRFKGLPHEEIAATQEQILRSMEAQDFYARVDWAGGGGGRRAFDQVAPYFTAASQPPLYYALAGRWLAFLPQLSLEAQLVAVRIFSWLLYCAGVLACLGFARQVFHQEELALLAALVAAWLPMHARQAGVVNNDVLARTLATVVLWISARWVAGSGSRRELALGTALCLLALATKTTAAGCAGALALALFLRARTPTRTLRPLLPALAIGAVVTVGVMLWLTQHNPALPRTMQGFALRLEKGLSWSTLIELWRTLVGTFGWNQRPQAPILYTLVGAAGLVGLGSALTGLVRPPSGAPRAMLVLCSAAVLFQVLLVVLRGVAHGRYLMPAVAAFAALLVAGLVAPLPARLRAHAAWGLGLALLLYDAAFLWDGLVPNEYLLWGS